MAIEWFYYKGDERIGPVESSQLKEIASTGKLLPSDLVWKEGMAQPVAASKLKGLFGTTILLAQAVAVARAIPVAKAELPEPSPTPALTVDKAQVTQDSDRQNHEAVSKKSKGNFWTNLSTPGKVAVIAAAFMVFTVVVCCGFPVIFGLFSSQSAKVSNSTAISADEKSARRSKGGKAMEERYKALVMSVHLNMTIPEVEALLDAPDERTREDLGKYSPQKAGQILEILTWNGESDSQPAIILGFMNGRLHDGGTPGYDVKTGFKSK